MAHLPVPVAWLGVVGRRRKLARKRRQNMEVAGVEEDSEQRSLQRLQAGEMASPERGGGLGGVAQAWEGLELPRRPEGIAGELELGDGGPRPARPGYGFLLDRGVCVSAGWCSRRLGRALFIGERRGCFGLRRWTPVQGARRRAASVRGGEGDGGHAATVGERRRAQDQGNGDEHSALRTVGLAGPCPCSLRRAPASASAREELRTSRR